MSCPALARCSRRANHAAGQRRTRGFERYRRRWPGWPVGGPRGDTNASALAHNRVPTSAPSAPSASAAASPRPSATPPAATTSVLAESRSDEVDDVGHQRESGPNAHSVPTRLAALRHDEVRAGVQGLACMVEVLHLSGKRNPRRAEAVGERPKIAERQHDCGRVRARGPARVVRAFGPRLQVMNPHPTLAPRLSRIRVEAIRRRRSLRRSVPRPPADVTAAASRPPETMAIGASRIGCSMPKNSVRRGQRRVFT